MLSSQKNPCAVMEDISFSSSYFDMPAALSTFEKVGISKLIISKLLNNNTNYCTNRINNYAVTVRRIRERP